MTEPIVFVVSGTAQPVDGGAARGAPRGAAAARLPAGLTRGRLKQSVRVGARRSTGTDIAVRAVPGEDIVVLQIAGGPALMLHPENARDLLRAQQGDASRSLADAASGEVRVTTPLRWHGMQQATTSAATRGALGDVVLSSIDVVGGWLVDHAAGIAASKLVERLDAQVDAGVYRLQAGSLSSVAERPDASRRADAREQVDAVDSPALVLVHGTFTTASGTFGKLWSEHPQRVRALLDRYRGAVYAFEHPTLGVGPIGNALALANACAPGTRLHLATHSGGGLVAEVLARVCSDPQQAIGRLDAFAGAALQPQREDLKALAKLVAARGIRVERVVRVACPARGTLLASRRLDAWLSVFKWTLELAGVPVAPVLVEFLGEVAARRTDPLQVPGLAAQMPDSALIRWLHAFDAPIAGDLRVISGDVEGDSVVTWLKTLLADAFYWTDNDLVVQTRSMYGGAPRRDGASFLLDQGGMVSHFGYFANERTADAFTAALTHDAPPAGFRTIGPLSWSGASAAGTRSANATTRDPQRPAVILLPGLLGSNLKAGGKRLWLGTTDSQALQRLEYGPQRTQEVVPDGAAGAIYDELAQFLSRSHDVTVFAYDWRRPIEEEARRLAGVVDEAVAERVRSAQPVRIVAHSTGGLLARALPLEAPLVWQRMIAHAAARVLLLGTPNGGLWAPMQMLSGDETLGNALTALAAPFHEDAVRRMIARCPGVLQLQSALLDQTLGLDRESTWRRLADEDLARLRVHDPWHADPLQSAVYEWGVPRQDVLDQAVALRRRLDAQRDNDLPAWRDRIAIVVGRARFTPDGFEIGHNGIVYRNVADAGDGRVTHDSARLPGVPTWQLDCDHGRLPGEEAAFAAYLDLLERGDTGRAILHRFKDDASTRIVAREQARSCSRPSRTRTPSVPPEHARQALAGSAPTTAPAVPTSSAGSSLRVRIVNGDLSFMRLPILIGHYRSMRLTGSEAVANRLIGGAMERSLKVDLYPDWPGAHQIFVNTHAAPDNPWQLPRPEAAIIVGLGEEGKLLEADLTRTICQAVIAWAQHIGERTEGAPARIELGSTLIGSGGAGIDAGQSARLIAQGVRMANERLADGGWPRVTDLHLIELYLDRASDAWRALQVQATAEPGHYVVLPTIQPGAGSLLRFLDSGYRGTDYDLITVLTQTGANGESAIAYRLDTRRARTEIRAQQTQAPLLRELVAHASNDRSCDPQIGRTLFRLLVPMEMEPFLAGTTEMLLEVDAGTAGIPWEILDADGRGGGDPRPWAIRTRLLRKLRTAEFRPAVVDANTDAQVLVIGEPLCDATRYARLDGARSEARCVVERLGAPNALDAGAVQALIADDDVQPSGADARTVVNTLLSRDWRVVHIAGHGEPATDTDPRGVVLSNGTFLGPREIHNMRVVPELVFVNCCHLAARSAQQLLTDERVDGYDRARFACGIAEELIRIGVRCVIAAGWAVEDRPAQVFATTFYDALLQGRRFMDAVAAAREAAWNEGGNTWAAYQCYGDPDWTLLRGDAQRGPPELAQEFAGVASPMALVLALQSLAVGSKFQKIPAEPQAARIRHLESRFALPWGAIGSVAEAFGAAWAAAGTLANALPWYERAIAANDGSATIKAAEQVGSLRARLAWDGVERAQVTRDALERALDSAPAKARAALRRKIASATRELRKVAIESRAPLTAAVELLERLVALQPSMERETLCGSAFKRKAMAEAAAECPEAEAEAIAKMKEHYERAETLGHAAKLPDVYYPALNRMAAEVAVEAARPGWQGFDATAVAAVRESLASKARDDPDFWCVAGLTDLRVYEALGQRRLAAERQAIEGEYDDLYRRVNAPSMWASIQDQMRFVLLRYAQRAASDESQAALGLLEWLESLPLDGAQGTAAADDPAAASAGE